MSQKPELKPLFIQPNEGRIYPMGRMSAIFKADLNETNSSLSVSEWSLQANTEGPAIHSHPEAHIFYVIEGSLSVYLDTQGWVTAKQGSYIYVPGGIEHEFENSSDSDVRFMSINTPGGFEQSIPYIVDYFEENPLGDASHT